MEVMKRLVSLLCSSTALLAAELSGVHVVDVFPMSRGMDQYLANRLTNDHVFRVVTDPRLADAFFSDRVGEALQAQLDAAFPKPALAKEAAKEEAKDTPKPPERSRPNNPLMFTDPVNKLENPALNSSFGRGKGNVFLVDAKSREVVWSTFDPPKDDTTKQMDRTASDIVNRIKKDLNIEKK
jgi:hypothetical protein